MLGPLVVSGAAFHVSDGLAEADLWDVLKASVTRRRSAKGFRLPVLDSKKLYSTKAGLGALERTALVMLKASSATGDLSASEPGQASRPWHALDAPATFRGLLELVASQMVEDLACYPWYDGFDADLPTRCSEGEVATRANAVRRDLTAHGVSLVGVFCEPLLEGHYNRLVADVRNKAVVSLGLVLRIAHRVFTRAGGERVELHVDRQGGRTHYREPIMSAFPEYYLRIIEESEARSAYALTNNAVCHHLDFVADGEDRHLPTALASIYSKYLRELFMRAFNAFWARQVAGLKPTAGYYTDAKRFLGDITSMIDALGIDRNLLVRTR